MLMIWMMEVKCLYINWLWNFFIYMAVMILFHSDWKFRSWFPRRHTVLSDRVIDSIDDYLSPNSQIQIIVNRYRSLFTWFKIMSLPDRLSCLSIEHCGCLQLIAGEILIQAVSGVAPWSDLLSSILNTVVCRHGGWLGLSGLFFFEPGCLHRTVDCFTLANSQWR